MSYREIAPKPAGHEPPAVLPDRPLPGCFCDNCQVGALFYRGPGGTHGAWLDEEALLAEAAVKRRASHRAARAVGWVLAAWAAGVVLGEVLR